MELAEIVKEYRTSHGLSMRAMAERCGVSHSYIAILESEVNPRTGEASTPSTQALRKLAKGMGITYAELLVLMGEIEPDGDEGKTMDELFPEENKNATALKNDRSADSMRLQMINRVMRMSEEELDRLEQILDLLNK